MSKAKRANKKAFRNNRKKRKAEEPRGLRRECLNRFAQFSSLSKYNMHQLYGEEGEKILNELIELNYIKKRDKQIVVNKTRQNAYGLTTKAQRFLKNKGKTLYYSNSARHDVIHATNVISQFKDYLDYYVSEKELSTWTYGTSRVDGAIKVNGRNIYLETITRNYKADKIQSKRDYMDLIRATDSSCEYIEFRE